MKKHIASAPGKLYILVIYDIVNDRRRQKFFKYLNGYGWRVQNSCFEAVLNDSLYRKLTKEVWKYIDQSEDSVRMYKLNGIANVLAYGQQLNMACGDMAII